MQGSGMTLNCNWSNQIYP